MGNAAMPVPTLKASEPCRPGRHRRARCFILVFIALASLMIRRERALNIASSSVSDDEVSNAFVAMVASDESDDMVTDTNPTAEDTASIREEMDRQRYWEFASFDKGDRVDCRIHTSPIVAVDGAEAAPSTETPPETASASSWSLGGERDKYVIHVHGLHHSGTGYLRQTLLHALNREFSAPDGSSPPAASMHDSLRPHQHVFERVKGKRKETYELLRRYNAPENEGHHLQSVYPRFIDRVKSIFGAGDAFVLKNVGKLAYLADLCDVADRKEGEVGELLMRQWSRYWDGSATFLLQKTPTLDVGFLERVKVVPTLHVILIRHPVTSNSWKKVQMGPMWVNAWAHVFRLLARDQVEWYAVVTYEALLMYHDKVVRELLEVVRSGMRRFGRGGGRSLKGNPRGDGVDESEPNAGGALANGTEGSARGRGRRLPHRDAPDPEQYIPDKWGGTKSSAAYLIPKTRSIELWNECLGRPRCRGVLKRLTKEVLPQFGYASVRAKDAMRTGPHALMPLSMYPGPVRVQQEFGRVLYTSEGEALDEFRQARGQGGAVGDTIAQYRPSEELITTMEDICF